MKNYIFLSFAFLCIWSISMQPPPTKSIKKMRLVGNSKPQAQFIEIGNLINSLDVKGLENYLSSHDLSEITAKAQEQFLAPLIASFSYFKNDQDRKNYAQIIQILIKNNFNPGKARPLYERIRLEIEKIIKE